MKDVQICFILQKYVKPTNRFHKVNKYLELNSKVRLKIDIRFDIQLFYVFALQFNTIPGSYTLWRSVDKIQTLYLNEC